MQINLLAGLWRGYVWSIIELCSTQQTGHVLWLYSSTEPPDPPSLLPACHVTQPGPDMTLLVIQDKGGHHAWTSYYPFQPVRMWNRAWKKTAKAGGMRSPNLKMTSWNGDACYLFAIQTETGSFSLPFQSPSIMDFVTDQQEGFFSIFPPFKLFTCFWSCLSWNESNEAWCLK